MLRNLLVLLSIAAAMYAGYAALVYAQQRTMMFPIAGGPAHPMRVALPANGELGEPRASFGAVRVVLLKAATGAAAPALIVTHGNAELVEHLVGDFAYLPALGAHVLLLEYPGYGGAPGAPTRVSLREAATTAFDWLAARPDVDAARIAAVGISVGGGPVAELAHERPVRALVLLSSFARVSDFAGRLLLPRFLVRDDFDNLARVAAYPGPVLVMHGRHDEVIPFEHGRRLAAASPRVRFVALECGHNDCPYRTPEFTRWLEPFLRDAGVLR